MTIPLWAWALFLAFVIAMLALDVLVLHRRAHEVSLREAGASNEPKSIHEARISPGSNEAGGGGKQQPKYRRANAHDHDEE